MKSIEPDDPRSNRKGPVKVILWSLAAVIVGTVAVVFVGWEAGAAVFVVVMTFGERTSKW